ncbi:sugar porter (SP) family MFS transporter [Candida albicans P60002]|uniref:Hgt7p n=3 Tax=Candida albicans TaxID=5476 RepID=A0A1D8PG81_CANAL|nr:Hgt7p [Candida albicans SC5314]KGQ96784.1 sugar porter (SP) family MFS transporter [Candida albicans P37005]KGR22164.1 sugar porter (SP) family MFS transporter [Candida albicans P37037]KGU12256.1 sugar porter (SP) family MFS transporter [Candida albicans P87]KGU30270.1 sugar porter (SP) family MFS transporter [Candida albicans P34048]KGU35893.1 sugar porter (SP) family MFS transporter [Candida albicans P57055]KHC39182.1 sugar porter (SP) family MFS transporter [Candida albicans P76067]KHC|eukprot:XP_719472.2 Hgt7p [Candida albicans SC5314]
MSQDNVSSTSTAEAVNNEIKVKDEFPQEEQAHTSLEDKPVSAYIGIIIMCFLIAFGGFVFGFDTGTISGFINMSDFLERFGGTKADGTLYFSNVRTGLMIGLFNAGCAIGALFLSKVGDMYGRRVGIMTAMIVYIVGIIVQIASQHAWYQVMIGRIITGLAVGMLSVLCPLFISEVSPKHLRGTLVCCFQLMITLGIFLGYCTTYGTKSYSDSRQWRIPLGLCFAWALCLVAGMVRMPESPRYLVGKDRIEDAKMSLAKTNKVSPEDPALYRELQLIQAGVERERLAGKASWGTLFNGKPRIFERVIVGVMLQALQQLTGDNYFFYYSTTIFKSVGMNDSFETSIIIGVINFASTFVGIYAIERMGRRLCLLTGSVAMSICFLIYSLVGTQHLYIDKPGGASRKPDGDAMIFMTSLYVFFFASTWAGGVYSIISELYPLKVRSKAMGLANASNWTWGFLISFFTSFITDAIHFYYGFVFMGCLVFSIFFVYFMVYETKGLTLEEIDELYSTKVLPWKSAGWVPPSEEEMATSTGYAGDAKPEEEHV